ncbi:MAG: M15 family metallopeptidase [Oscillospiraceae bacterium]|nr:M15 family metallopeptidase [Oscillospiraceae bacterium]
MKRFIHIVGLLLVLCVAAVFFMRYTGSERHNNGPGGGLQASDKFQADNSHMGAPPLDKPSSSALSANSLSEDILLVNAYNPLPEGFYPENLVNLYKQKGRSFQLARADIEISENVYEAMNTMFTAAKTDGAEGFIITSGYRTRDEQNAIFVSTTDGTAAMPGTSEHETGLAFDVTSMENDNFELTSQFKWLSEHCASYGFIIRYPPGGEDITGYPYEPWHYRYVGKEHAETIMASGLTLEEYLEN